MMDEGLEADFAHFVGDPFGGKRRRFNRLFLQRRGEGSDRTGIVEITWEEGGGGRKVRLERQREKGGEGNS